MNFSVTSFFLFLALTSTGWTREDVLLSLLNPPSRHQLPEKFVLIGTGPALRSHGILQLSVPDRNDGNTRMMLLNLKDSHSNKDVADEIARNLSLLVTASSDNNDQVARKLGALKLLIEYRFDIDTQIHTSIRGQISLREIAEKMQYNLTINQIETINTLLNKYQTRVAPLRGLCRHSYQ